nr:unnamed protein product [Callosobruchus analis]
MIFSLKEVENYPYMTETNFLGVYIDNKLKWYKHIDETAKKLSKNIYLLRSLPSELNYSALKAARSWTTSLSKKVAKTFPPSFQAAWIRTGRLTVSRLIDVVFKKFVYVESSRMKGNHSAQSNQCTKYKEEFAIQQLKVVEKISYFEAKNRVAVQTPTPNVSYSAAARSTTLIDQILPALKTVIQETINREVQQLRFPVPQFTTAQRPRTSSLSLPSFPKPTDKYSSEKRKRETTATPGPSEEEAASSDDSVTKSTKKKAVLKASLESDEVL